VSHNLTHKLQTVDYILYNH